MIIVRIYGGLGNQLFQYAFGLFLSQKNNREVTFDFSFYSTEKHRSPSVKKLNFPILIADLECVKKFVLFNSFRLNKYFNQIFNRKTYHVKYKSPHIQKVNYYDGYWQNLAWVKPVLEQIKINFELEIKTKKIQDHCKEISGFKNTVAIHVRRTDYLLKKNKKIFVELTSQYYLAAESEIIKQLNTENIHLVIFSDDPDWVKENLNFKSKVLIVENNQDYEDLYLMSLCENQITANSTFSWWAAMLNKNDKKTIITPNRWYKKEVEMNKLIPKNWILIKV